MWEDEQPSCTHPGLPREPIFQGDYAFNTGHVRKFGVVDFVFFGLTLVISTIIGFYHGWRNLSNMSTEEYFTASHSMHPLPVCLSLSASFFSGVTLVAIPVEVYNYSTMNFWAGTNFVIAIAAAAYIFIPLFYQLKTVSCFQYLEMRFCREIRSICSTMYILYMIAYLSFCLSGPSIAVSHVTGIDIFWSTIAIGFVCSIYTAVGGMRAVIWTDTFQIVVSLIGVLVLLIRCMMAVGGIGVVWESALRTNRIRFADFRTDPALSNTFWSIVIGMSTIYLSYGFNQSQVMRSQACRSVQEAQWAVVGNIPGLCFIFFTSCFIGLYMSTLYENCDPVKASFVHHPSQISSLLAMDVLGDTAGLPGLFIAGVVSATLSSMSSGLNSLAAVAVEDYVKIYFYSQIRTDQAQLFSQIVSVFFGAIIFELNHYISGHAHLRYAALSVISLTTAPLTGVFLLGILIPQCNLTGAWTGLLGCILIEIVIFVGKKKASPMALPDKALTCVSNCNLTAFSNASISSLLKLKRPPSPLSSIP
ncbi:sodium-coupled monocarboxylate transporter [Elysia marginata]|uniref:Sodium-coupled monocarboxylate transporter n=1 Tax=Elysia marginata TaxID=1093978 RepID=A0AAV4IQW3_9GAST|nr:sodium-coupled monocarboxylate transporter [Elysia marginata]